MSVSGFSTCFQAAALALFGPVMEVNAAQYNQIVDLSVDTESTLERENMDAIRHVPRVLALHSEKQSELMAHLAQKVKPTATWPERVKVIEKWLDTPADKRPTVSEPATANSAEVVRTDSGARLCTGAPTDRNFRHTKESLGNEIALGILAREHEFNIYSVGQTLYQQAEKLRLSGTNEEFSAWYRMFITTPGGMDFSRAINIAVVKTAPEGIWKDQIKHREYFNRVMIESDHATPDPMIIDIACGRSSAPMPHPFKKPTSNADDKPSVPDEAALPAVCPGKAAQLDKELNDAFANGTAGEQQTKIEKIGDGVFSVENLMADNAAKDQNIDVPEDNRQAMTPRQKEIAYVLNDLFSGRTGIMSKEEAEGVVSCTGHMIPDITPMLIDTLITTESCLSPAFSDEEIHDVATTILDAWSDNQAEREKIATDAIVEYRSEPELPQPAVIDLPVITAKPKKADEPVPQQVTNVLQPSALTYQQQLTLSALQGLCANPAHATALDDLPAIAADLAAGIIRLQEPDDE